MGESFIKKNGLLYSQDLHTVYGVDSTSSAFSGRVPYGAHEIQEEAFADSTLVSVSLPDSVKKIGAGVFGNCKSLQKVKLPSELKELSPYLFAGCSSLKAITMPTNLQKFSEGLFFSCSSLEEIPFRFEITELPDYICAECTSLVSIVFPEGIKKIGAKAFSNCKKLNSIVLPAGIETISADAFEGCVNLHNIRINGENKIFFINQDDNCLYERTAFGDKLIIKTYPVEQQNVKFYEENLNDDDIISDEEDLEDDDFFSAEIGPGDEELIFAESSPTNNQQAEKSNTIANNDESWEDSMENTNEINSVFENIMNEERERAQTTYNDIGVSEKESLVLTEMMDVMKDSPASANDNAKVSTEDLEKLSEANEQSALEMPEVDSTKIDSKTTTLINSVGFSKVYNFEPTDKIPENSELFVIAESTITNENGEQDFSIKLTACCKKIAEIQSLRRVIMISGLPFENEEFLHFYYPFMAKKNVLLACDANSPTTLSEYGRKVCEQSRISLDKEELNNQRKRINIKNDTLIKLVIRDIK